MNKNYADVNITVDHVKKEAVMIRFSHFLEYAKFNKDDDPLCLHDTDFGAWHRTWPLIKHYTRPTFFGEDVLGYLAEAKWYGYRSINIAPKWGGNAPTKEIISRNIWEGQIKG